MNLNFRFFEKKNVLALRCNSPPPLLSVVPFLGMIIFLSPVFLQDVLFVTGDQRALFLSLSHLLHPSSALPLHNFCALIVHPTHFFSTQLLTSIFDSASLDLLPPDRPLSCLLSQACIARASVDTDQSSGWISVNKPNPSDSQCKAAATAAATAQQQWPASHLPRRQSLWPAELDVSTPCSGGVIMAATSLVLALQVSYHMLESLHSACCVDGEERLHNNSFRTAG